MSLLQRCLPLACLAALAGCLRYPARFTSTSQHSSDLDGVQTVEVETPNGRIEIVCGAEHQQAAITVVRRASGRDDDDARDWAHKIEVSNKKDAGVLRLSVRFPEGGSGRSLGADFAVKLPPEGGFKLSSGNGPIDLKGAAGDVEARSSNGKIKIESVQGNVVARSSNGPIDIFDVAGDVDLETKNGKVTIDAAGRARVRAVSGNGDIEATRITGGAALESGNGAIELELQSLPDEAEVVVRSGNGAIEVQLPGDARATIEARSGNGSVRGEFGGASVEHVDSDRRHLNARLNGGGSRVEVRTGNGSVKVKTPG